MLGRCLSPPPSPLPGFLSHLSLSFSLSSSSCPIPLPSASLSFVPPHFGFALWTLLLGSHCAHQAPPSPTVGSPLACRPPECWHVLTVTPCSCLCSAVPSAIEGVKSQSSSCAKGPRSLIDVWERIVFSLLNSWIKPIYYIGTVVPISCLMCVGVCLCAICKPGFSEDRKGSQSPWDWSHP